MSQFLTTRDPTLDIAKGIAIILVVLGHTFQGMHQDFDHFLPFLIIYSFHMPLFIFLSGAVAGLRPAVEQMNVDWKSQIKFRSRAIGRSAIRLLLPFMAWTLFGWGIGDRQNLGAYLLNIFRNVDISLWFLITIFYCSALWNIWHGLIGSLCFWLDKKQKNFSAFILSQDFTAWIGFWYVIHKLLALPVVPSLYGIGTVKLYLGYYVLGAVVYRYGRGLLQGWMRFIPYLVFIALAPFFDRLNPGALSEYMGRYIPISYADSVYRSAVACAGILMVLDSVRIIMTLPKWIGKSLAYCGVASLGIYAIHFRLMGMGPAVVTPLVGSLLAYAILSRIPVLRLVLLGETKVFQPIRPFRIR